MILISLLVLILVASVSRCKQIQPNHIYLDLCLNCAKGSKEAICKEGLDNVVTISSQPPDFVYRADFRAPGVVFNKGKKSEQIDSIIFVHGRV